MIIQYVSLLLTNQSSVQRSKVDFRDKSITRSNIYLE